MKSTCKIDTHTATY